MHFIHWAVAPPLLLVLASILHTHLNPTSPFLYRDLLTEAGLDILNDISSTNPTALITGCTSGIGLSLTKRLYTDLNFEVICLSRSSSKMEKVAEKYNMPNLITIQCDLSDLESVKTAISKVRATNSSINYLVNNAGIHYGSRKSDVSLEEIRKSTTPQGFDEVFAANYLGHFLLTEALVRDLKPVSASIPPRVVQVSSSYHYHSDGTQLSGEEPIAGMGRRSDSSNAELLRTKDLSYGNSKLAQILQTRELVKRKGKDCEVIFASICPSWVGTNIVPESAVVAHNVVKLLAYDVETDGINSMLMGMFHPGVKSGDYLGQTRMTEQLPMGFLTSKFVR